MPGPEDLSRYFPGGSGWYAAGRVPPKDEPERSSWLSQEPVYPTQELANSAVSSGLDRKIRLAFFATRPPGGLPESGWNKTPVPMPDYTRPPPTPRAAEQKPPKLGWTTIKTAEAPEKPEAAGERALEGFWNGQQKRFERK